MNWKTRIKLTSALLTVGVIVAGLLLYVDKTASEASAQKAELIADSYSVGIDYSGNIVEQYVQEGDMVREGQDMFKVKSTVLTNSVREFNLTTDELLYPLDEQGNIVVKANKDGIIADIAYGQGSFVPANEAIAKVIDIDNVKAQATFRLPRKDFALLGRETVMSVRLPDGSYATGKLSKIDVVEQSEVVVTEVQSTLESGISNDLLIGTSTPVVAEIKLRNDNYYDKVVQYISRTLGALRG